MNTDKLFKVIQILVESEVKKQLPIVLKEMVEKMDKTTIVEKVDRKEKIKTPSIAKAILGETKSKPKNEVRYTKNPILNQILNETKNSGGYFGAPTETGFEEYPTMKNPMVNMNPSTDKESIRASIAQKMGYGDITTGLGVKTGNDALDKALNRDYRELVKRF
jgi:hypothetical protein